MESYLCCSLSTAPLSAAAQSIIAALRVQYAHRGERNGASELETEHSNNIINLRLVMAIRKLNVIGFVHTQLASSNFYAKLDALERMTCFTYKF